MVSQKPNEQVFKGAEKENVSDQLCQMLPIGQIK